jgi:hypothetical protein
MSLLSSIKKALNIGQSGPKKRKGFQNIRCDVNPEETWEIVGELGDGAFGKVHKARHRENHTLAAAKICQLEVSVCLWKWGVYGRYEYVSCRYLERYCTCWMG